MDNPLLLDPELIKRYDLSGPRYTSYPTALQFDDSFTADDYRTAAEDSNRTDRGLSLYFHIPFCDTICFFCACNKIATKDRSKAQPYLERVYKELELQSALFDSSRPVRQLHWGGGTPTFISNEQMHELMLKTGEAFQLVDDDSGEYSIEIDPREADREKIMQLREIGFNRISLGVQDFDHKVQVAVNRIQPEEQTIEVLTAARDAGFKSVSVDLIYGLPLQTADSFDRTLDRMIEISPDRLSVFNYAHLPERFKPQRRINENELPPPEEKLEILRRTGSKLAEAGYVYIGMDHFAKPEDELVAHQKAGTLYRNFQGYSTHADCDLIGIGVTSIGMIGNVYAQNMRGLDDYNARIDAGELAVSHGLTLTLDDMIRRDVITRLICNFQLDISSFERKWRINFAVHFARELERLQGMVEDELLVIEDRKITVQQRGRLLIRNICMQFDAYLDRDGATTRYSKVL
jgi:oxygen-independent coproporphyrinogen-3 oxidase